MTKILGKLLFVVLIFTMIVGCASKNENEEYDKPAIYWYNKILKQINMGELDLADDTFTSLESEHSNSPLIASSLMILVDAHIDEEEYEMTNYYLDEYIKRYAFNNDIDYIRYLKIKSKFMSFKSQYREQQLILNILEEIEEFNTTYINSPYKYLVGNMYTRVAMAKASFDEEISNLYTRIDKPVASKIYKQRAKESFLYLEDVKKVSIPWYRAIFENGVQLWN
jgi:outer membrane protein assembly factor BamD